ncbi:MAG: hypothetical protein ACJATI_004468 [Halioglobus sp.]|jgi:hypothetical protein
MNTINKFFFLLIIVSALFITSCVDNDFDEPENTFMVDQSDVVTVETVMNALDTTSSFLLTDDFLGGESKYLQVTATADDASGNLFKVVFFEDETGPLSIIPDRNELNAEFPTGAVIYIKLNGLTISNSGGTPQLGYGIDEDDQLLRIPDVLVNDFMFLTNERKTAEAQVITIADFQENEDLYLNRLVTFENVEFTSEFAGGTYAITNADTGETPESINAVINDCDNNTLIVRNSGFSEFANDVIPTLNGSLTGVLSKFGTDLQLFLRDKNDVVLNMPRCIDGLSEDDILDIKQLVDLSAEDVFLLLNESSTGRELSYIRGTIVADDESGTFYKNLIVQDETGGIKLSLDGQDLYKTYPIGAVVLVALNGLTLESSVGTPTIGDGQSSDNRLERIEKGKIGSVLIGTTETNNVEPLVTTIENIISGGQIMLNRLVTLPRVELPGGEVGNPFATENRNINLLDCDDELMIFRSSEFADFAGELIPNGSGSFTGVTGSFFEEKQILLRTLSDLNFDQVRCDGSGGEVTNELTIESIKQRYYDLGADAAETGFITGSVISDKNTGQLNSQNIVFQNGSHGILVRFNGDHSFALGDQLKINVSGQEVSEFKGLLQVNNVPVFNAEKTGSGDLPAAKEITIDEILLDNNRYESTRVLIKDAELSGGSTYGAGNITVDDGTETISIFTFNTTSYANEPVPSGMVNVTAIVSQFEETPQLMINAASDVSGGTIDPGGNGSDGQVNQTFEGFTDFDPVSIGGWLNVATKGDRQWYTRSFDNNGFVECEAFNDDNPATEAWLVTPTIDTDDKSIFSFETAIAFWQHQGLSVWISQDFSALNDANWVSLDEAVLADSGNENYEYVASGDIELTDYLSGKVRIGFKYEGTAAQNTTKVRIDNVELK